MFFILMQRTKKWPTDGHSGISFFPNAATNPEVAVAYELDPDARTLYGGGKVLGDLEDDEVLAFSTLIIKSNERMRVMAPATRSSDGSYDFVDEAFNPMLRTRSTYTQNWDYDKFGDSDFIPKSVLNDLAIDSYQEFGSKWKNAMHRDYIYYGFTKEKDTDGELNPFVRESILRFRVDPDALANMSEITSGDPYFVDTYTVWRNKNKLEGNAIQSHIWSDGAFELEFTFYFGEGVPDAMTSFSKIFSVRPEELKELENGNHDDSRFEPAWRYQL